MPDDTQHEAIADLIRRKVGHLTAPQALAHRLDVIMAYQFSGQLRGRPEYEELCDHAKAMFEGLRYHPATGVQPPPPPLPADAIASGHE